MMTCPECDGTGYHTITCRCCNGSGWRYGRPGGEICCGGTDTEDCAECGGTGEVEDDDDDAE